MSAEAAGLEAIFAPDRLSRDPERCALFSEDIAGPGPHVAAAVVRPDSVTEIQALVRWARRTGAALIPRGGGMSYTAGYVPAGPGAVLIDMADIDGIDPGDGHVRVGAGVTWSALNDRLVGDGRRVPFFGPLSGIAATIGGTLSQNGTFFGSTAHGYAGDQVLGLEVVDGRGDLVVLGAAAFGRDPGLAGFGPAPQAMLIGDAGAFGIKVAAVLRTIALPEAVVHFSFTFQTAAATVRALAALADLPHVADLWAFDRETHRNLAQSGFSVLESAGMAADIAGAAGLRGAARALFDAARLRTVRLADLPWSLHGVVEVPIDGLQGPVLAAVAGIVGKEGGTALPDTIPRVTRARPFRKIKALVGPDGGRWLPCHGIVPAHRGAEVLARYEAWRASVADRLGDIRIATLLAVTAGEMVIEPQFFWPDSFSAFQRAHAQPDQVSGPGLPDNPDLRASVHALRAEVTRLFDDASAGHIQIGKYYRWAQDADPAVRRLLQAFKTAMDPDGIINPGALGL